MSIHVSEDISPLCINSGFGGGITHYLGGGSVIFQGNLLHLLAYKRRWMQRSRYPLDGWREQFHSETKTVQWSGMSY